MSPSVPTGVQKRSANSPSLRVTQRFQQAEKVDQLGIENMAPCSNCQKSQSVCIMQKGVTRCSCCIRKNMKCDGQYSEAEYQSLEKSKHDLRKKVEMAQMDMARYAAEFATNMAKSQKKLDNLQRRIDGLTQAQSDMVVRASAVLDALDAEDGFESDEPELSSGDVQPNVSPFAFDDAQLEALMSLETSQDGLFLHQGSPSALGEFLVPRCFPSRRILTI